MKTAFILLAFLIGTFGCSPTSNSEISLEEPASENPTLASEFQGTHEGMPGDNSATSLGTEAVVPPAPIDVTATPPDRSVQSSTLDSSSTPEVALENSPSSSSSATNTASVSAAPSSTATQEDGDSNDEEADPETDSETEATQPDDQAAPRDPNTPTQTADELVDESDEAPVDANPSPSQEAETNTGDSEGSELPLEVIGSADEADLVNSGRWQSLINNAADDDYESERVLAMINEALTENAEKLRAIYDDLDRYDEFLITYQEHSQLMDVRRYFFENGSSRVVVDLRALGSKGQESFQLETELGKVAVRGRAYNIRHQIYNAEAGLRIDEARLIRMSLQLIAIFVLIFFWFHKIIPKLTKVVEREASNQRAGATDLYWIFLYSKGAFEWMAFIYIIFSLIDSHIPALDINQFAKSIYWVLGGFGISQLIFALGAVQYRRDKSLDQSRKTRWLTIQLIALYLVMFNIMEHALDIHHISGMTIDSWSGKAWIVGSVFLALFLSLMWKGKIFRTLHRKEFKDKQVVSWIHSINHGLLSYLAVLLGAIYLTYNWLSRSIVAVLSGNKAVRTILNLIGQLEFNRQQSDDETWIIETPVPQSIKLDILEGPTKGLGVQDETINQMVDILDNDLSTITLLYGRRSMGKSHVIDAILERYKNSRSSDRPSSMVRVDCPPGDFGTLTNALARIVCNDEEATAADLISKLRDHDRGVIAIDNIHRIITPAIDGLSEFERLVRVIRRSSDSISWILSVDTASWRYVERARGERLRFDQEIALPTWHEQQIRELVETTIEEKGYTLDFSKLTLPRQPDEFIQVSEEEQTASRYFRILSRYATGNPGSALTFFVNSLYAIEGDEKRLLVGLFDTKHQGALDELSIELMLVLRAIMQLGWASKATIERSTLARSDEVIDALRLLTNKRIICKNEEGYYEICWDWYPEVSSLLHRKHLLQLLRGNAL